MEDGQRSKGRSKSPRHNHGAVATNFTGRMPVLRHSAGRIPVPLLKQQNASERNGLGPHLLTGGTPVLRARRCEAGVLRVQRAQLKADMANRATSARPAISLFGAGFAWRVEQVPTPALYPTGTSA
jgi:hypothetical protein